MTMHAAGWTVDLADPDTFLDGPPHDLFRRMRDEAPVLWTPASQQWTPALDDPPGFWNVTRAADIARISMDPATYSSWLGGITMRPKDVGGLDGIRSMMIGKDGLEHARQRGTVSKVFTPRRVQNLENTIRERATTLIDRIADRGACDVMNDLASPLVVHMIGDLLGVPDADRARLTLWAEALSFPDDVEFAHVQSDEVIAASGAYLMELLQARMANPQDDLITAIGHTSYHSEVMPPEDQVGVFIQIVVAAIDSTRATIGTGITTLLEHPDQLEALTQDPSLMPSAVEEMLRWAPAFNYFSRTATRDTELHGYTIGAGDTVVLWYCSGSRDPRVVDRPDVFDITRSARASCPHQAFGGGGRHFCLGGSLARQELTVFFEELTRRLTDLQLTAPPERVRSNLMNSYKRVPIRFTAIA
jgi:cholest-4-en-3-one 26-monooxygenase